MPVAEIWADLLGYEEIHADDNFFELGGFSILAMEMVAAIGSKLGVAINLKYVMEHPVFVHFVAELPRPDGQVAIDTRATSSEGRHPVSLQQESMLRLLEGAGKGLNYDLEWVFDLSERIEANRLAAALETAAELQPALRTRLGHDQQVGYFQEVLAAHEAGFGRTAASAGVLCQDLFGIHLRDHAGPVSQRLVIRVSHVIFDGWSLDVLLRCLEEAYARQIDDGRPAAEGVGGARLLYSDYARWQRSLADADETQAGWQWWLSELAGYVGPSEWVAPLRAPRREAPSYAAAFVRKEIDERVVESVALCARRLGVTPFAIYLAAFAVTLQAAKVSDDVVIGTSTASRYLPELANTVGYVANGRLTRVRGLMASPRELIEYCADWWTRSASHAEIHMEQLVDRSGNPDYLDVKFSLQDAPGLARPMTRLGEVTATLAEVASDTTVRRPLDVALTPMPSGAGDLLASYRPDTLTEPGVESWLGQYCDALVEFATSPDASLVELYRRIRQELVGR
ncbi:hypothetical protein KVF89_20850 [Nocardioides carbamazepini]|uniref:condensation domain-containing protein n=1 Tax=Nocardioides carbamazepini TaxID=2854259 RepID=UPI00214A2C17|nr:condensation domain-containing protein [Nocardioides carbamazepini]MCR1785001.1 hypothetical protein [Nocardioides carbamazepini]